MANVIVIGRGTMGAALISSLKKKGHRVLCSATSRNLYDGDAVLKETFDGNLHTQSHLDGMFGQYVRDARIVFLAIPAVRQGTVAVEYVRYFTKCGVMPVLFSKDAFAHCFNDLVPHLDVLGDYPVVGGGTQILPWLRSRRLRGKECIVHAYINGSANHFLSGCAAGRSMQEMFSEARLLGYAEPGGTDVVSFIDGEITGDIPLKISALMNAGGFVGHNGRFFTPARLEIRKDIDMRFLRSITLPSHNYRYVVRITNVKGLPLEHDPSMPGSILGTFGEYDIAGGFHRVEEGTMLAKWMRSGVANGVRVQFEDSGEGAYELTGPGAGLPTVAAAINNMEDLLARHGEEKLAA